MSRVFVDTSAILALLNPGDKAHRRAGRAFGKLHEQSAHLVTHSYVLVETYALLQRRMGVKSVEAFRTDFAPLLEVEWVDADLHGSGLDLLLERRSKALSLVDCVSFLTMRRLRLVEVFAFDPHFRREGFNLVA
jgi:predicted nucleic acid-binding protein